MAIRVFAIIMALAFVASAVVQYNDPDPHLWIPIYLFPAILSVIVWRIKDQRPALLMSVLLLASLFYFAGAIYQWPAHWEGVALRNGMKTVNIEEGRESLGLGLVFITLFIYWLVLHFRTPVRR
ncbi:MAG: transmembrane 220 family protein [Adhaeribacter sp.]